MQFFSPEANLYSGKDICNFYKNYSHQKDAILLLQHKNDTVALNLQDVVYLAPHLTTTGHPPEEIIQYG